MDEIRFTTFIDECTECQVFVLIRNGEPLIQTINIIGDCAVTYEDLDDEGKAFFLSEVARVMRENEPSSSDTDDK